MVTTRSTTNTIPAVEKERLLFVPQKGTKYRKGDYAHACKQQPIPMNELPRYLTDPDMVPKWEAPILWLGWLITEEDLLKLVEAHYPDEYDLCQGEPDVDCIFNLPDALRKEYDVSPRMHECVDIAIVARQDGTRTTALSVGCSSIGIIKLQTVEDIQTKFGLQRPPEWLLDGREWKWARRTYTVRNPKKPKERTI
ncbi:hypothetical protein BDZ89DRAFT_1131719 [Hymenopellis radicata]|nr:hypothetical protein BDZ89DRAFT_1131719 [Hymenopellis radicata]